MHCDAVLSHSCKLTVWRSNHSSVIHQTQVFCALCCTLSTCHSFRIVTAVHRFREWYFILHLRVCFLHWWTKPSIFVASVIFGFCMISYADFQPCLLTHFKGVILVLKPYIILYVFIFDREY